VVATKVYFKVSDGPNDRGSSRYHIQNEIEKSLKRLQTDHIDLYQLHRWDDDTPIEESLRALDDLVRSGKVRYIGASAYTAWQLAKANLLAEFRGWTSFATIQSHYHMFERDVEREVLPYCRQHGVGFIPYFPLAGGFLTGKYRRHEPPPAGSRGESSEYVKRYMTDSNYERLEQLEDWSQIRGHSMLELAHAWLLAEQAVCSVISGATGVEQLRTNASSTGWDLSPQEKDEVDDLLKNSSD